MTKKLIGIRINKITESQITELKTKLKMQQTEVITMAVNDFYIKMENKMNKNLYDIVAIVLCDDESGEYQVTGAHTGDPVSLKDWRAEIQESYELGTDILPVNIKDIRGLIRNQPDTVLTVVDNDNNISYWGANKI